MEGGSQSNLGVLLGLVCKRASVGVGSLFPSSYSSRYKMALKYDFGQTVDMVTILFKICSLICSPNGLGKGQGGHKGLAFSQDP